MLTVEQATAVIRAQAGNAAVVLTMSPIGFWGEPREQDFRLVGTMGAAGSLGLGVALGTPERAVWIVDGDGSLAMQLGVTLAIGDAAPQNLLHILVANDIYAVSGAQPVPGRKGDWTQIALGAGYRSADEVTDADALRDALRGPVEGPRMLVVRCEPRRPDYPPGVFASIDPAAESRRIRKTLAPT